MRFCLSLNLHVVAEGIEVESQPAAIRRLGCHVGEDFLLARPMAATSSTPRSARGRRGTRPARRDARAAGDAVVRAGGDEFVTVVRLADEAQVDTVVGRLEDEVLAALAAHPAARAVRVGVSAGAAVVGKEGLDVEDLLFVADQRRYAAKRARRAATVRD